MDPNTKGVCICDAPFTGDEGCSSLACPSNDRGLTCSGKGSCEIDATNASNAVCECSPGFGGKVCADIKCASNNKDNTCSGNGECQETAEYGGVCKCKAGF